MKRILILSLSVLLLGFQFPVPARAHCGRCDEGVEAKDEGAKHGSKKCCPHKDSADKGSVEDRVSKLEGSLKNVGGAASNGSPYTSKSQRRAKSS